MEFRREKEIVWKDGYCNAHFQRIIVEERNGIAQWNGINYRTRAIDESEEDSNADSDEKDEGNTEVTGRNSIKKKPSTMDPHVVQKRLRAAQSDDNTKTKRLKLCAGTRRMYRDTMFEWDVFIAKGEFPKRKTNRAYFTEEMIE